MIHRQLSFFIALIVASTLITLSAPGWAQNSDNQDSVNADDSDNMMRQRQRTGAQMNQSNGDQGLMNRGSDSGGMMNRNANGDGMMGQAGNGGEMNHGSETGGMGGGMMMQRMQQMHEGFHSAETSSGQSAFDMIKSVVDQLQANPDTNWAQVDIPALRQHLVDMNQLTLYAQVAAEEVAGGASYRITGDGITREAIQRMVPTHAAQLQTETEWEIETETIRNGVRLTVNSQDAVEIARIRGLGFMGFMVQGEHHQDHHLMMAGGLPQNDTMSHDHGDGNEPDHSAHSTGDQSGH